jgi:CheY-like chemotaxis protein
LDETPVYTLEMTNWIVATFEQAAIQKNVLLQVSRNFKNQYVYADKVKIQQILLNVVSNAIKFTREHGLVRVSLRDCAHETPGMCNVEIVVEDTGVGISEEFMPRIFDEFEREQTALTRNVEGTGLGLSIVKKLVDLMHGTVKVTSRVGEGTRVVLTLPLRTANEDDVSPKADQNATHVKLAGKHALLVDDDPKTCEIVGEILKDACMRVVCVESGSECVQKIDYSAAGSFDVILMDLRLPGMDGFETARRVRQLENPRNAKIPILALTANVFDEDRQRANKAGMNGLISKPVTPSELFGMLGQVLT